MWEDFRDIIEFYFDGIFLCHENVLSFLTYVSVWLKEQP